MFTSKFSKNCWGPKSVTQKMLEAFQKLRELYIPPSSVNTRIGSRPQYG